MYCPLAMRTVRFLLTPTDRSSPSGRLIGMYLNLWSWAAICWKKAEGSPWCVSTTTSSLSGWVWSKKHCQSCGWNLDREAVVGVTTDTLPQTCAVGITFAKSMPRSIVCNSLSSGVTPGACLLVCTACVIFNEACGLILFVRLSEAGCIMFWASRLFHRSVTIRCITPVLPCLHQNLHEGVRLQPMISTLHFNTLVFETVNLHMNLLPIWTANVAIRQVWRILQLRKLMNLISQLVLPIHPIQFWALRRRLNPTLLCLN